MRIKLTDQSRKWLAVVFIAFHVMAIASAFKGVQRENLPYRAFKISSLLSARDLGFERLGSEMDFFKPYLPQKGEIAFITDSESGVTDETVYYHNAENHLAPLMVTHDLSLPRAIVFCSDDTLANKRLAETGYQWQQRIYEGKGIAVKIQ